MLQTGIAVIGLKMGEPPRRRMQERAVAGW